MKGYENYPYILRSERKTPSGWSIHCDELQLHLQHLLANKNMSKTR